MPVSPASLELAQVVVALALLGLSLVCLPAAYAVCWRTFAPNERRWLGGAVVVGAITRWLLAPHLLAMIFIGYKQTEHALTLLPLSHYGVGATAFYHGVFGLVTAPDHQTMLLTNAVVGVLTLPLLGALAARLLRDGRAGVIATWLVALTPLFIRNDASEANIVPTLWWLSGGLVLLDAWATSGRRSLLAASVPLLALAAIARPEMPLMLAVLVPLTGVAAGWPLERFRKPWTALAAGGLLVTLAVPHMVHTLNAMTVLEGRSSLPGLAELAALPQLLFWERNVVLRPDLFPLGASLCALVGLALLPRRVAITLLLGALFALGLYVVDLDEANIARVHVPGALLITLLAAGGIARLWSVGPRPGQVALAALTLTLVSGWPTAGALWAPANEHTEEALIEEATAALPDGPFTLVRLGERDRRKRGGDSRFTHYHFPDYRFRPPQRDGLLRSAGGFLDDPGLEAPTFFFHGMRCYAEFRSKGVDPPEGEDLHTACARMHQAFVLEPVFERQVRNHGDVWIRYYGTAAELKVGLYRVVRAR
jgi:hypothetical protein